MTKTKLKTFLGRKVKEEILFSKSGTFKSMWEAEAWLRKNGYGYGSTSVNRSTCQSEPVAIKLGEYDLPQKWHNFNKEDKKRINGVMISDNFREGMVKVIIFED